MKIGMDFHDIDWLEVMAQVPSLEWVDLAKYLIEWNGGVISKVMFIAMAAAAVKMTTAV